MEEGPVDEGPAEEVEECSLALQDWIPCKDFFKCKYPLLVLLAVLPVLLAIILVLLV